MQWYLISEHKQMKIDIHFNECRCLKTKRLMFATQEQTGKTPAEIEEYHLLKSLTS